MNDMETENLIEEENDEQLIENIQANDYYDSYYEKVLKNMDNIITGQNTVILNQETIISQYKTNNLFISSILFVFCVFLIYYLVRNMIIVR